MTPDSKKVQAKGEDKENNSSLNKSGLLDEEDFFDFITRFQSKRMDDQRCSLTVPTAKEPTNGAIPKPPTIRPLPHQQQQQQQQQQKPQQQAGATTNKKPKEDQQQQLFDLIGQHNQGGPPVGPKPIPYLPGLTKAKQPEILQRLSVATGKDDQFPDESFFEMLMKCQGSRIEEQRSSLPSSSNLGPNNQDPLIPDRGVVPLEAPTVPDEDFFNLIQRLQSGRLEDQRATLPKEPR